MHLSRRTFLRGAGAAVALPVLESLLPRRALAVEPRPVRVLYYYVPNGVRPAAFVPTTSGPGYAVPPILKPLHSAGLLTEVNVISGLDNEPAAIFDAGAHFRGTGGLLTAATIRREQVYVGTSVDQIAAQAIGDSTPFRSLQLGLSSGSVGGLCGDAFPCPYITNISWSGPTTPMDKEILPQAIFDRLFAGADHRLTTEQLARRRELKRSILDFVSQDAEAVRRRLGRSDRNKMDEYLTGVRELERRIDRSVDVTACDPGDRPPPVSSYLEKLEQMHDLMVLAFRCDLTRIISFMTYNAGATDYNLPYSWCTVREDVAGDPLPPRPIREPKHSISHHAGAIDKLDELQAINTWEVETFGRLLTKLRAIPDGEGTLLDQSLVIFTSEYADPDQHDPRNLPCIVAGRGGGRVVTGRHLAQAPGTPWANLLLTMLQLQGVAAPQFANSTGLLDLG